MPRTGISGSQSSVQDPGLSVRPRSLYWECSVWCAPITNTNMQICSPTEKSAVQWDRISAYWRCQGIKIPVQIPMQVFETLISLITIKSLLHKGITVVEDLYKGHTPISPKVLTEEFTLLPTKLYIYLRITSFLLAHPPSSVYIHNKVWTFYMSPVPKSKGIFCIMSSRTNWPSVNQSPF